MKNFTSVEFMTVEEKQKVLKDWQRFLKFLASSDWKNWNEKQGGSDYGMEAPKQFTKRLYNHLSLHCGFIAHYNIHGFYSVYFSGDFETLERFFRNINHYGDYADLGEAMQEKQEKMLGKILKQGENANDDKFELLKECVSRAETDLDFRKRIIKSIF